MHKHLLVHIFFCCYFLGFSQTDFDNYRTLKSNGDIPSDFTSSTYEKIKESKSSKFGLSNKSEKVFLNGVHYHIDELLHGGQVTFGDPISLFVQSVADKILVNHPDLKAKLRFYTLKSTATNAFSTAQGIIFVTTGLISKLENEAQLAFVIGHEIAHYMGSHSVKQFDLMTTSRGKKDNMIAQMSKYSRSHEMEADEVGLQLYHDAGYSKKYILGVFDMLSRSHLPFEEHSIHTDYFDSKTGYAPSTLWSTPEKPIVLVQDDNDSLSSHPNIEKRKENMTHKMESFSDWGNTEHYLTDSEFQNIQDICRFETVRIQVFNEYFVEALYSITILEKSYPNSHYLNSLKAKSWYGLACQTANYRVNRTFSVASESRSQGELYRFGKAFRKLNKVEIFLVSFHKLREIANSDVSNKEYQAILSSLKKVIFSDTTIQLTNFSKESYSSYLENYKRDFVHGSEQVKKSNKSYKFRAKASVDSTAVKTIDTLASAISFAYFLDQDFFSDPAVLEEVRMLQTSKANQVANTDVAGKKKKKKNKYQDDLNLGLERIVIVEPIVELATNRNQKEKSEKLTELLSKEIEPASRLLDMEVVTLSRSNLHENENATQSFNEKSLLFSYLSHLSNDSKYKVHEVDYTEMAEFKLKYKCDNILFMGLQHTNRVRIVRVLMYSLVMIPVAPIFALPLYSASLNSHLMATVVNIENAKILGSSSRSYRIQQLRPVVMRAYIYNLLSRIQKPSL